MLNSEQIKGKWDEIKGGVRNIWGNITDEELEQTHGNLEAIPSLVKEKYTDSNEEIKTKMDRLLDSFDNETDKSLKLNDGIASYQRNPTSVRNQDVSQRQDQIQDIKTRSPERSAFEKKNDVSEHPNAEDRIARH